MQAFAYLGKTHVPKLPKQLKFDDNIIIPCE